MNTINLCRKYSVLSAGFVIAALFIGGCGGGGGGANGDAVIPTAAVQITPTNAASVASAALTGTESTVSTGTNMSQVVGVVAQASGPMRSVLSISLAEFKRVRSMSFSPAIAGVIQSQTFPCSNDPNGSWTGSFQDTNNNGIFDVGDKVTLSFNNCADVFNTFNGSATFAVTAASGPLNLLLATGTPGNPFTATFTLTFNHLSIKDNATQYTESINGDISFTTSDDGTYTEGTMSGSSLRLDSAVDGAFLMTNYLFSFSEANIQTSSSPYSFTVNMTIASTFANGSVTITTPITFVGIPGSPPTVGVMVITGANNSTLTLTANADGIHIGIVLDEDGPGGPLTPVAITNPNTSVDYTWDEI